jgi:flagellar motor switch protein FliM
VRSLYLLHDLFAHNLSSSLPLFLRAVTEVDLISVEQQSYGDYLRGLADPTAIFKIFADRLNGVFALEMNSSIAFPVIDRMLGGEGHPVDEQRAVTELELEVLEGFLAILIDNYREAWDPIVSFKTELKGHETHPQLLQIVSPNEVVVVIAYRIQIGDAQGAMSICLPVTILETVIENFSQSSYSTTKIASPEATRSLLQTVSTVKFPIVAVLEETPAMVSDLMALSVGDVLRTSHRVEKNVNVCIGDSTKFMGRLAACDGKMIVQITETKQKK